MKYRWWITINNFSIDIALFSTFRNEIVLFSNNMESINYLVEIVNPQNSLSLSHEQVNFFFVCDKWTQILSLNYGYRLREKFFPKTKNFQNAIYHVRVNSTKILWYWSSPFLRHRNSCVNTDCAWTTVSTLKCHWSLSRSTKHVFQQLHPLSRNIFLPRRR